MTNFEVIQDAVAKGDKEFFVELQFSGAGAIGWCANDPKLCLEESESCFDCYRKWLDKEANALMMGMMKECE